MRDASFGAQNQAIKFVAVIRNVKKAGHILPTSALMNLNKRFGQ